MRFTKIAMFAIAFSTFGSFCMGMDQQQVVSSTTSSAQGAEKKELMEKFVNDFLKALMKSPQQSLQILQSYEKRGLIKANLRDIRFGYANLLDWVCLSKGDDFLPVIKYLAEDLDFNFEHIQAIENGSGDNIRASFTTLNIKGKSAIERYLRSNNKFQRYFR
jgi:hypothetical protein